MISANQLSIYGAIADLCNDVPKDLGAPVKPAAPDHLEKMEIPTDLSFAENFTNAQQRGNLVPEYERKFAQLSEDPNYPNYALMRVKSLSKEDNYFYFLDTEEGHEMQHVCREYTMPGNEKKTRAKGWILKNTRIGPVLNKKVCYHHDRYSIEVQIPSLFEYNTFSWVRIVNCVDTHVTESVQTKKEEDIASVNPIARSAQER